MVERSRDECRRDPAVLETYMRFAGRGGSGRQGKAGEYHCHAAGTEAANVAAPGEAGHHRRRWKRIVSKLSVVGPHRRWKKIESKLRPVVPDNAVEVATRA